MGVNGGMMLTPVVKASAFKIAKPEDATLDFPCFKCHLPQALRWATDSVAKELAGAMADPQDKAKVAKLQITCKVCHWEQAIVHHQRRAAQGGRDLRLEGRRPRRQDLHEDGEERHSQAGDLLRAVPRDRAELRVRQPGAVRDALRQLPAQLPLQRRSGELPGLPHAEEGRGLRPPDRPELRRQGVHPEVAGLLDQPQRPDPRLPVAAQGRDAHPKVCEH
jgi:hypothetical protein